MRYIPTTPEERAHMLRTIGVRSLEDLFADIPERVRLQRPLRLRPPLSDPDLLRSFRALADENAHAGRLVCFAGAGAYDHFIPPAVWQLASRGEFLTAYTPYQPEVSQGALQAGYEYQTMVCELLSMEVANASLYDGASALAEAVGMARDLTQRNRVVVSTAVHPEYRQVVRTYTASLGVEVVEVPHREGRTPVETVARAVDERTAAVVVQQPNFFGGIEDPQTLGEVAHRAGALFVLASADPLAFGLLAPPGEVGADVVAAEGQPLGNPLNFGGPSLGILATRMSFVRRMPGRLVGATVDAEGRRGFVLTLQTREQHIRREKATSNICTNEFLNALAATLYLSLLGPDGVRRVAELCVRKAHYLKERVASLPGYAIAFPGPTFHEFVVRTPRPAEEIVRALAEEGFLAGVPLGRFHPELGDDLLVCVTESRTREEMDRFVEALRQVA
ncbi:MAG: aminomethyl-transferring glycine dehydrogenase subunit GcvPA [Armatimonadota bacterium]|nr:aminomethyl-transferring glycine dehydrogenase subunit GcvPA [Armatimonadota bacterium]MDR7444139.1 aminomethyl-transferring glycine dehydrogenase subunit GcvPA [Armatimonadota bacterium]MDR7569556.1 aminomethyl-transferring glycine dehydrogenase subunit GcvPA [Armatimonadota bacterium]MDR7613588.1 aminomethyl-transferring glycine dehydrogenase subunit GcvPA [Armatimonadota bacterium]